MRKALLALASVPFVCLLARPAAAWNPIPQALTERGQLVQHLFEVIGLLGLLIFVIVFVWMVVLLVRFREGTGHGRATHEKERHSLKAEMTWTLVPLAMVLWIGYAAYGGLMQLDHGVAPGEESMTVHITASQWNWQADYGHNVTVFSNPDMDAHGNVSAANTFYVPAEEPILFNVTSSDVIHAWQVMDVNHGYVMFVDANPLGANKYNHQTATFPAGDYLVQCNKMCLNPGHAYMHAAIKAVPRAEFDDWMLSHHAQAGRSGQVVLDYAFSTPAGSLMQGTQAATNLTLVTDAHVVLRLDNPTSAPVQVTLDGQPLPAVTLGDSGAAEVPAGGHAYFTFDTGTSGRTYALATSNGGAATFTAVSAIARSVDLADFRLIPDHLDLQVGKTYLIQLHNVHVAVHNLYIGHHGGDVLANSVSIAPGGAGSFLFTPATAGQFEMWCNVAGHYGAGMHGTVTVT